MEGVRFGRSKWWSRTEHLKLRKQKKKDEKSVNDSGGSYSTKDSAIGKQKIHKVIFLEKPFGSRVVLREISCKVSTAEIKDIRYTKRRHDIPIYLVWMLYGGCFWKADQTKTKTRAHMVIWKNNNRGISCVIVACLIAQGDQIQPIAIPKLLADTAIAVAKLISESGNQATANCGGIASIKTCATKRKNKYRADPSIDQVYLEQPKLDR